PPSQREVAHVAAESGEGKAQRWSGLAALIEHHGLAVDGINGSPVHEGWMTRADIASGVQDAIRPHRHAHAVPVKSADGDQNSGHRVRDKRGVVIGTLSAVVVPEVEQAWNLLEIRRYVRVVAGELRVVEG